MNSSSPPPPQYSLPPQELQGADSDLFDYAKLGDFLGYGLRAIRRHRGLVLAVLALVVLVALTALAVLPKTYRAQIKIQAQRNIVIGTLAGQTRQWDYDLPTKAAADLVLRHDNLVSLVRKTDLVKLWGKTRAPIQQLKDFVMRKLRGEIPDDAQEEMLVGTLEQRINVTASEDTVTITVDWSDAATAFALVRAAHVNFLEARQYIEISSVSEAIVLLESRASEARAQVNSALERVQKLRPLKPVKAKNEPPPRALQRAAAPIDPELERLRGQLRSKHQVIGELEEFKRRRVADLAAKLAELKQVYSEFHPAVVDLEQTLQQEQRQESPQLAALRQEYAVLQTQYERRGGPVLDGPESLSSGRLPAEAMQIARSVSDDIESPEVEQAKADLKHEVGRYSTLIERVEQARLELETQRAAFAYRYSVLRPAAFPSSPEKPKAKVIVPAAVVLGLILGFFAAVGVDIRSRRVLERWQVERLLDLPVLAEITAP